MLTDPTKATAQAPARYKVEFATSRGNFVVEVHRDWAPMGADRFYNLVQGDFYDGARFFRAIRGFMVQFGISGYPDVNTAWRDARIKDDPVKESNKRGKITFATSGPDSRTTQVFINLHDNPNLDNSGFAPFGEVVSGMDVVDQLYMDYGEGAPRGRGPDQMKIQTLGNVYLDRDFPKLDSITDARILQ
jgi:peptidyl-prolyl cis-trans isomerase A (cyclophilin A)